MLVHRNGPPSRRFEGRGLVGASPPSAGAAIHSHCRAGRGPATEAKTPVTAADHPSYPPARAARSMYACALSPTSTWSGVAGSEAAAHVGVAERQMDLHARRHDDHG